MSDDVELGAPPSRSRAPRVRWWQWMLPTVGGLALAAGVVLLAWVALTGALHLDGLADSADAWIGGMGDRERTLAIMKDPRSGPAGVVAVVVVLLLKFAALASLPASGGSALLLVPLLARAGLMLAVLITPYARSQGLASGLGEASRGACGCALAITVLLALFWGWHGLLATVLSLVALAFWRQACMRRLGGFTGDTCGALAECLEALLLVTLAA